VIINDIQQKNKNVSATTKQPFYRSVATTEQRAFAIRFAKRSFK
jgi:hypothetical protein